MRSPFTRLVQNVNENSSAEERAGRGCTVAVLLRFISPIKRSEPMGPWPGGVRPVGIAGVRCCNGKQSPVSLFVPSR